MKLVSITSNEPANGTGDGNTSPDIAGATFGTDDRTFQLRAERKGNGNGRIYTVTYSAQDASGNTAQQIATVTVAHDQGVSDYTVDASPTSATIKQGQSAAFALTVTPTQRLQPSGFVHLYGTACWSKLFICACHSHTEWWSSHDNSHGDDDGTFDSLQAL